MATAMEPFGSTTKILLDLYLKKDMLRLKASLKAVSTQETTKIMRRNQEKKKLGYGRKE